MRQAEEDDLLLVEQAEMHTAVQASLATDSSAESREASNMQQALEESLCDAAKEASLRTAEARTLITSAREAPDKAKELADIENATQDSVDSENARLVKMPLVEQAYASCSAHLFQYGLSRYLHSTACGTRARAGAGPCWPMRWPGGFRLASLDALRRGE